MVGTAATVGRITVSGQDDLSLKLSGAAHCSVEVIDLDFNLVYETREKLPLLKNRRTDVYTRNPSAKLP